MKIKAIITALDNLDNLKESITVLRDEPLEQIIVVNNGSRDGTAEWLATQPDVTAINRENLGAGPGRNAGLDAAGEFDYVLQLDGGIRPLRGGTAQLLDYLDRNPEADTIGVEIPDFETDYDLAWRRWPYPIEKAYRNTRLSHTAYCLARAKAWDGLRFSEEGPFGEPGWGADDDEMAYQWNEAGINVHVATGVHPYRRASGSFRRLYRDTGIWPNQYGSVYEKRVVWLMHHWPQHEPVGQWGEPWLTVVVKGTDIETTAATIRAAHDLLRPRRFEPPFTGCWNPYHVHLWSDDQIILQWARPRHLRQHHGDVTILDEYGPERKIIKRNKETEATWAGDFIINASDDWQAAIRPGAFYYTLVSDPDEAEAKIADYNREYPHQLTKQPPEGGGEL